MAAGGLFFVLFKAKDMDYKPPDRSRPWASSDPFWCLDVGRVLWTQIRYGFVAAGLNSGVEGGADGLSRFGWTHADPKRGRERDVVVCRSVTH